MWKDYVIQSSESLGVLTLIFPSAPVVQGWTTACDWLEAPLLGHSSCHRFIESCPQGVLRTIWVVIQPESSGWGEHSTLPLGSLSQLSFQSFLVHVYCILKPCVGGAQICNVTHKSWLLDNDILELLYHNRSGTL